MDGCGRFTEFPENEFTIRNKYKALHVLLVESVYFEKAQVIVHMRLADKHNLFKCNQYCQIRKSKYFHAQP